MTDSAERGGTIRVLVVDDHADTLAMMGRMLSQFGVDAIPAMTVAAAMRALERVGSVDAAFVDRHLGDGGGLALVADIRAACDCKIIIVSGNEPPAEGLPAGVDGWIVKPVDQAKLLRAVESLDCR